MGQGQIQYDLLQNTTWSPLATKPLPAIAEQSNAEKHNHESLSRAVAMESATVNIQQEKECDSLKISAEVHNNNCQLESSGLQSGMIAEVNNNNCQPENSSLHFGMLAKVDNNNNNPGHEGSSLKSLCSSPKQAEDCVATVHLLQAVRLPGRHEKLVKLQINQQQECDAEHLLLKPDQQILCQLGLDMESMLILNGDKHDCTTVPVLNFNMDAKHLDKGQAVGKLYPVTLEGSELDESSDKPAEVRALDTTDASPVDKSHWDKLCQVLRVTDVKSAAKPDAVSKFYDMLKLYANVFVLEDGQLGSTNVVTHSINTGDSPPIKQHSRRIPFALRKKVEKLVDDMLEKKVMHPSKSPWASPVVLVAKKNGDTRFCVDYRRLNSVTKMDVYPLPRIDDMLDSLSESRVFSTLDLASGF